MSLDMQRVRAELTLNVHKKAFYPLQIACSRRKDIIFKNAEKEKKQEKVLEDIYQSIETGENLREHKLNSKLLLNDN